MKLPDYGDVLIVGNFFFSGGKGLLRIARVEQYSRRSILIL
jgi:hypothetical protein